MVPESPLEQTGHGLVPTGKGWFVLNAREAPWISARDKSVGEDSGGYTVEGWLPSG